MAIHLITGTHGQQGAGAVQVFRTEVLARRHALQGPVRIIGGRPPPDTT
jgi:hypothetical protein